MIYHLGSTRGPHRDCFYRNLVVFRTEVIHSINGYCAAVAQLTKDDKWWIIPEYSFDNDQFEDVGPFDTSDQAVVTLLLMADR